MRAALRALRPVLGKRSLPRLQLPPDVTDDSLDGTDAQPLEDSPDVPLPPLPPPPPSLEVDVLADLNLGLVGCQCQRRCIKFLTDDQKFTASQIQDSLKGRNKADVLFHLVKEASSSVNGHQSWRLLGQEICRTAFLQITGVSKKFLAKTEAAIASGHLQPWDDQRRYNGSNDSKVRKQIGVDSFFCFLYQYLAEPLADADEGCQELVHKGLGNHIHEWVQARDGNPLAQASAGLGAAIDKRYLPHMTWAELFDMYVLSNSSGQGDDSHPVAKRSCFDKIYKHHWAPLLGIRQLGQHARCTTCATLSKLRREHPDPDEREAAAKAYDAHLNRMFNDRRVDMRLTRLSELSTSTTSSFAGCLHVRIDGMDQSKFKCPRNIEDAKMWSSLWRPTLHLCGIIVEGVVEMYLLMDEDQPKDSNMEITALCFALNCTANILMQRGVPVPEHLSVKFDNTAREGKNQHVAKFLAWLTATGVFLSAQDGQGEVGHTHDGLDQRFGVIATILSQTKLLSTPGEFKKVIENQLQTCRNRVLIVEQVEATYNWQAFFDPLGLVIKGIAATASTPSVCHSKRFVARRDLPSMHLPGWNIEAGA